MMEWVVDDFGVWHVAQSWALSLEYVTTFCGVRLTGAGRKTLPQERADGPACDGCLPAIELRDATRAAVEQVVREMGL